MEEDRRRCCGHETYLGLMYLVRLDTRLASSTVPRVPWPGELGSGHTKQGNNVVYLLTRDVA